MYSAPDPDVADAHIPVDRLPRWDDSAFTTPGFLRAQPFLSPTLGEQELDAFCRAAVHETTRLSDRRARRDLLHVCFSSATQRVVKRTHVWRGVVFHLAAPRA